MQKRMYMTHKGKQKLEIELRKIKFKDRPKVLTELEAAIAQGDLSENAEYHAAKERLGIINAKIDDLESKLARAEVVDISKIDISKVVFGTLVKLVNLDTMAEISYRIVGDFEAEIENNEISISSPVARVLIGKTVGDEVTVNTPGGVKQFEIVEINR